MRIPRSARIVAAAALCGLMAIVPRAHAVVFTGSSGDLSASANFSVSGSDLYVALVNDSSVNVTVPSDVLTGLFFDISGVTLAPVSATVAPGSDIANCTTANGCTSPTAGNVGGEWAYADALSGAPGGAGSGISSSGLGLFGSSDRFDTSPAADLQPPVNVDGVQFGLANATYVDGTGNGGINTQALIRNAVIFVFSGLPDEFSTTLISNVSFQYGTALDEPNIPGSCAGGPGCGSVNPPAVPIPGALPLFATGLGALGLLGWRRKRKKAAAVVGA